MPLPTNLRAGGYDVDPRHLYGVAFILHAGDATYEFEVQRAPDSAGAPDVGSAVTIGARLPASLPFFVDFQPNDNVVRWYRVRHTDARGEDPSDWSEWQAAVPEPVTPEMLTVNDAPRRIETIWEDDGILAADVRQRGAGVSVHRIAKGHLAGTGKNGDAITFPQNFAAPPLITIEGGISYEPRGAQWSGTYNAALPQYFQREAVNVSVSGFTLRARLRQKGTATNRTHNFAASNNLDAVGETTALTLANAPSNDDSYVVHYSVSLTAQNDGPSAGATTDAYLDVAIDTMTDGSTWVQRAVRQYHVFDVFGGGSSNFTNSHEQVPISVTGVDATDQVRIRIVGLTVFTDPGSTGSASFSVHGFDGTGDPAAGVTYDTAADIFATMTPDTPDVCSWHAIEVDA